MEAKDIISEAQIQGWIDNRFGVPNTVNVKCFQDFATFIFKPTFKAGQESRESEVEKWKFLQREAVMAFNIAFKAGERKVVEWVKANALFVNPHNLYWQEFLKSEGIE